MWIRADLPTLPDGIAVTIGPLVDLPDDREGWIASALLADLPLDATAKRIAARDVAHDHGWPITVVAVAILDARGRELERRIVFMFRLEVFGGLVVARVAPHAIAALEATLGRELLAALVVAPIRMHGSEVVAIAELDA